jgi:predicted enzyme related to lactoylglutathione lyase
MSGLRPHLETGPETHLVSTNLVGGTLVENDSTTGKVKPSVANSTAVLGLALGDAAATAGMQAVTQDAWGRNYGGGLNPPNEVAVAYRGSWWVKNTSGTAWTYGQRLYSGAGGIMQGTVTTGSVVAICIDPAGVANNAEGRVRLTIR